MKNNYNHRQPNYLPRTAIGREQKQFIKIAFAVHLSAVISAERYRSDSGALKRAVSSTSVLPCTDVDSKFCIRKTCKLEPPPSLAELIVVFFYIIMTNKIEQSAAQRCLNKKLSLSKIPTDRTFENRRSRYKELGKKVPQAYRVYVEDTFLPCDAVDARIFSKDDEHTQRVYIRYGNGVETRYKYDEKRRWLDTIETKNNQTQDVFQKIKYSFDPVGNVLGYNNDASTYETKQTYSYDNLYQLISVEGTSNQYKAKKSSGTTPVSIAKYRQTFAFDGIGNMKEKLSTTNIPGAQGNSYPKAELDYSLAYEYDPAYAHRLIRAGNRYYRYDANGNITAEKDGPFTDEEEFVFTYSYFEEEDVYGADYGFGLDAPKETEQANPQDLFAYRRNYTWNERNLLTKSSDKNYTVHYRYGEDGQRALKYTDEGRSETLYFNNFFTIHIPIQDQNNPQGLRVHKHIFVGNSRLVTAMTHTDNSGDNDEQKTKRYYYHSDHLGSAQFVTDWRGKQYEHIEYTPYGELWVEEVAAGLDKLPFRFTGKELDEETGLYYYGARYLDPKYSRWLSGDPALNDYIPKAPIDDEAKKHNENLPGMGGVFNVVNLHVYHYAGNNPVKYTDPDGRETKQSGKGTIDEPFIQITVTNAETDAYKYTTTINYTSYMDNGKIFEQYSINSSFLIKDTEAGTKLANDMNVGIDMGYTLISSILIAFTMKQIDGNNIAKIINGILAGISSYTGSKYVFKYESGMKIETNTELEVVSDSSGVINSGNRTTNVYKREREDSDGKPIITCTENLNY
ncbi:MULTISPECIES: RHS repeat domain-containing protein [unclassified Treponema]|nr:MULTISPECIES: RHS repeat-associated core domain-containing protein [unclassified Treponema]